MINTTEKDSNYTNLEEMSIRELLININQEDQSVPSAIQKAIPKIEILIKNIVPKLKEGGRVFYIGAGTSGRLGVVDASECPPTFGVSDELIIGLIAGGDKAIRKAVENAEDNTSQAWLDISMYFPNELDSVIGIAASGTTPYVLGGIQNAKKNGLLTGCIVCNENSPISLASEFPIEIITGPEFLTGSTRMKAGTAQKLVLNMISTSLMIQLGKVKGNKMVDMHLSNAKLRQRAINMIMNQLQIPINTAEELLEKYGNVRKAIESFAK
jgi:N-acetylmuramic acid 6-phosphate etherase